MAVIRRRKKSQKKRRRRLKERIKGQAKLIMGHRGADLRVYFMFFFLGLTSDHCVLGTLYRGRFECYPKAIPTCIQE